MCETPERSPAYLARVDVHADDVLARLGERDGKRQPDIAESHDSDAHANTVRRPVGAERRDLPQRLRPHVRALGAADVPGDRRVERGREIPARRPAERARGPGWSPAAAPAPPRPRRPAARRARPARPASAGAAPRRPRPTGSSSPASGPKFQLGASPSPASASRSATAQVALERAEDVLPGPDGLRRADLERLAGLRGPHDVGHEPARRGVPAADHVARAGGDDGEPERRGRRRRRAPAPPWRRRRGRRRRAGRPRRSAGRSRRCGSTCRSSRRRPRAARRGRAAPRAPWPCPSCSP